MEQLSSLQSSVLALVKQFVGRQSIVLDAMRILRPHLIMPLENRGNPKLWSELRIEYSRKSQNGYWGEEEEWEYFLHGAGCRLTHRQTGEIIEWDAGDLNEFNVNWFVGYLQWLLKQDSDDEDIKTVSSAFQYTEITIEMTNKRPYDQILDQQLKMRAQILPIFEQLYEKGLLSRNDSRTHYILIT